MDSTLTYARIDWPPVAMDLGAKDWKTRDGVPGVSSYKVDQDGRLLEWRENADLPSPVAAPAKMTFIKAINRTLDRQLHMLFDQDGVLHTCTLVEPFAPQRVLMDRHGALKAVRKSRKGAT